MNILRMSPKALAGMFVTSGITHLARPQVFMPIMPRVLPEKTHQGLIYASGVVEMVCAAGLYRNQRWAGTASLLVLIGVFPANLQMALDAGTGRHPGAADTAIVAWGRLPLQIPMLLAAWKVRKGES